MESRDPAVEAKARYEWARAEYARIQRNEERWEYQTPGEQSALFARLLGGQHPLPHRPPTTWHQPWYQVIEESGPFPVRLGGVLESSDLTRGTGVVYLEYLLLNNCPWGVASSNASAREMVMAMMALKGCRDRRAGDELVSEMQSLLLARPEWEVVFDPWPSYTVSLGRGLRTGVRREVEGSLFARDSFDGTNRVIHRVLHSGQAQYEGRCERLKGIQLKRPELQTGPEKQLIADLEVLRADPPAADWVEYSCDVWMLSKA
jgi:hypothetical protein